MFAYINASGRDIRIPLKILIRFFSQQGVTEQQMAELLDIDFGIQPDEED